MEEKQLTSRELEEQANALLAEADFEEINLPKKAKKAAAAKKANEDTAQAEKPAEKYPPLDEKLVASLPAAALLQGNEKLMEIFAKGKAKGKLSSSDLMETIDEMNLESEQLDQIYDSLETLRHRGRPSPHARRGRQGVQRHARAHPPDRSQGAAQAPSPQPQQEAQGLPELSQ